MVLRIIKSVFFDNLAIKLFSLLFAVLLWLYVVTKGKSEVNFVVPLELKDLQQSMMVVSDVPGYLDVRLRGQEEMLKGLSSRGISAFIDLKNAGPGEMVYHMTEANVKVPRNIAVTNINPDSVKLRLEPIAKKTLPVKAVVLGRPAAGRRVAKITIDPEKVTAVGPASSIDKLFGYATVTVDVDGAVSGFDRAAAVDLPPTKKSVRLEEDTVKVTVSIVPERKTKGEGD